MKKNSLFLLVASASLIAGVSVGVSSMRHAMETQAGADDSAYKVVGIVNGGDAKWNASEPAYGKMGSDQTYDAIWTGASLKAGDKFKFAKVNSGGTDTDWSTQKNATNITGGTAQYYIDTDGDNNLNILSDGIYDFKISGNNITVDFNSSSPAATYSYVVSYDSNYARANAWTPDTIWAVNQPGFANINSGSFGGYHVTRTYDASSYNFWGIYKIDDRYLGCHQNFSLAHDSTYSTTMTISGTQKVYFENKETSADADVYNAVKYLYDFGYARAPYTYNGKVYSASTCAVLDAGTAEDFIADYEEILKTVNGAAILNNASMFVYDAVEGDNENLDQEVALSDIIDEISKHVQNGGGDSVERSTYTFGAQDNSMILPIVAVSAVAAVSIGGYFFLRRRKEN